MSKLIRTAAAVATAIVGITFTGCSGSSSSGGDIATVNDQHITKADFDRRLESSPTAKQVLTQLVQQALIDQYGKDQKITISQSDIDKKEADIKSKYPPGQFEQILAQQGLTEADVQNILRQQLIIEQAVAPMVHVSDSDIAAYFAKNHATLDKPGQVRARHILVPDEKTADMIEAKLKAGGDFAALAKQYSTDPASKDKGGELGFFGPGQMVPAFQAAAFALPVGATSAPVKSPFGWHIINVEEKKPAFKATLAGSHAQIKDLLTQQQEQQQIPVFLQGLRAKANIVVNDDRYKDAFPPPLPAAAAPSAAAPSAAAPSSAAPAASAPAPAKS
jgi:foldase protein PrsA